MENKEKETDVQKRVEMLIIQNQEDLTRLEVELLQSEKNIENKDSSLHLCALRMKKKIGNYIRTHNIYSSLIVTVYKIKAYLSLQLVFHINDVIKEVLSDHKKLLQYYIKVSRWFDERSNGFFTRDGKRLNRYKFPSVSELQKQKKFVFENNPLISILVPVYNTDIKWLEKCVQSVINQTYTNWELCLADDGSTKQETINYLREIDHSQIKVFFCNQNGNISKATNAALDIATGEYISLLDSDDEITPDALFRVVSVVQNKDIDFIYSDECIINKDGSVHRMHFKPDYSPDTLLSQNYICHFTTIKTSIVKKIGGFLSETDGAQDHDLFLRALEYIKSENVYHIQKILYKWRRIETSTVMSHDAKPTAWIAGLTAVKNILQMRGVDAQVELGPVVGTYDVFYDIIKKPKVTVIMPFKDQSKITISCIKSVLEKTTYSDFNIVCVSNNSKPREYETIMHTITDERVSFLKFDEPFNYSKMNNYVVRHDLCDGEFVVLLNNDMTIITKNWIERLLAYAQRDGVGVVGAKLYYPNNLIQHGGVLLGVGGIAGHFNKMLHRSALWKVPQSCTLL